MVHEHCLQSVSLPRRQGHRDKAPELLWTLLVGAGWSTGTHQQVQPTTLLPNWLLSPQKMGQCCMVSSYHHRLTQQMLPELFKPKYYSQQFLASNTVALLCLRECSTGIRNSSHLTILFLLKHHTKCVVGRIGVQNIGAFISGVPRIGGEVNNRLSSVKDCSQASLHSKTAFF